MGGRRLLSPPALQKRQESFLLPCRLFFYSTVNELITELSSMALRVKVLPSSTR